MKVQQVLLISLLLLGLLEIVMGFQQFIELYYGKFSCHTIHGSLPNSGSYACFISIILPLASYGVLQLKSTLKQSNNKIYVYLLTISSITYCIGAVIILPFTTSRCSWIAAMLGCSAVLWQQLKVKPKLAFFAKCNKKKAIVYCGILLCFLTCIGMCGYLIKKDSADGRLFIWKVSSYIIRDNFLFGVGKGGFSGAYGKAQADYFQEKIRSEHEEFIAGAPEYAYNEYIQIVIEYGAIGLFAFIMFIIYAFYNLAQSREKESIAVSGALVSLLSVALFSYPFRIFHLCSLALFVIGWALIFPRTFNNKATFLFKFHILLLIGGLLGICYSFGQLGKIKRAQNYREKIVFHFNNGRFKTVVNKYALLYPYLKTDASFLFEYGQCLSQTGEYCQSNKVLEEGSEISSDPMFYNIMGKNYLEMKNYNRAEEMFMQAFYRIPHRIYPLYLLMNLYIESGRSDDALKIAHQIINKKEKVTSLDVDKMKKEAKFNIETIENQLRLRNPSQNK